MDKAANQVINALIRAGASEARYYNSDTALQIAELMPIGRISSVNITTLFDKKFLRFEKDDNITLFYGIHPDGKLGIPLAKDLRAERYIVELNNVVTRGDTQYIGSMVVTEADDQRLEAKTEIIKYSCSSESHITSTRYMLAPKEARMNFYFPYGSSPDEMARLLEHADNVFARTEAAFRKAAEDGHVDVMPLYFKLGVDVKSRDSELNTAAHKAAWIGTDHENPNISGNVFMINLLRKAGADLTIPNKKGQKVIDYASVRDHLRYNYDYVPESKKAA